MLTIKSPSPVPNAHLAPDDFRYCVNETLCTMEYEVTAKQDRNPCMTYFGGIRFPVCDVFRYEGVGALFGNRGVHHIRADHIDDFIIAIPMHCTLFVHQNGAAARVEPGSFICVTTMRPYHSSICAVDSRGFDIYVVKIPGPVLRQTVQLIDDCCGRVVKIRRGATKMMVGLIELALAEGSALSAAAAKRFGMVIVEAMANAALEAPELADARLPLQQTAQERIFECAKVYIERNLSDPELDSRKIAGHCRISVRYLHAIFAAYATTVGSFIRTLRLRQCRAELQNPALRGRSVTEILSRWGFNDPAHFSRAYKGQYGIAPSRERAAHALR
jgi:AraC-like DNA-binding protein